MRRLVVLSFGSLAMLLSPLNQASAQTASMTCEIRDGQLAIIESVPGNNARTVTSMIAVSEQEAQRAVSICLNVIRARLLLASNWEVAQTTCLRSGSRLLLSLPFSGSGTRAEITSGPDVTDRDVAFCMASAAALNAIDAGRLQQERQAEAARRCPTR